MESAIKEEDYLNGIGVHVITKQNTDVAIDFGDSDDDSAPLSSPVSGPNSDDEERGVAANNAADSPAGSPTSGATDSSAGPRSSRSPRSPNAAKGSRGRRQTGKPRRALVVRFEPERAMHIVRYTDGKGPWFFDPEAR